MVVVVVPTVRRSCFCYLACVGYFRYVLQDVCTESTSVVREGAYHADHYASSRQVWNCTQARAGLWYPPACSGGDSETALDGIGKATTGDDPNFALYYAVDGRGRYDQQERRRHSVTSSLFPPKNPPVHTRSRCYPSPRCPSVFFFFARNRASNVGNLAKRKRFVKPWFLSTAFYVYFCLSTPEETERRREDPTRSRKKASDPLRTQFTRRRLGFQVDLFHLIICTATKHREKGKAKRRRWSLQP